MTDSSKGVQKMSVNVDYRWISLALLAIIVVLFFLWKPWSSKITDRTVEVTGQATVSARPDEFTFYPAYEFRNASKETALTQMTTKSDEVVAGLKKLGVADKNIKTNSDSWSYPIYLDGKDTMPTYTLRLTVVTNDEKLTQKVQDYLVSTVPTGSISPIATFSETKLKEVEQSGRNEATKDARAKAEQSAKNLGFKLSAVKTVTDGSGFGAYPTSERFIAQDTVSSKASLSVQAGENALSYTVTVTYYIK